MEKIGIIGAGKVGFSFGKYLTDAGFLIEVGGYFSKSVASAREAAEFTNTKQYGSLEELLQECDVIFITVPDSAIADVWETTKQYDIAGKIFCHCSGALASTVFQGIEERGAFGYSVHPFMAVSDKYSSYQKFSEALFTIEGHEEHLEDVKSFLEKAGLHLQVISKESKLRYHASASLASNCMVGLTQMAIENLVRCGFSEENARLALKPLMLGNLSKVLDDGAQKALTGPVERADAGTVKGHISVFEEEEQQIYCLLSKKILEIAKQKNPERDYKKVEEILGLF